MAIQYPFEKLTDCLSVEAAADLDALQYHFVKYDGSGNLIAASVLGEAVIGVLQNDPDAGETGVVGTGGYTRVVAGAAVALGALVATNTSGRAVTAGTGNRARGEAVLAAAADGDIITIRLLDVVAP